jgi:hypothetical protein
MSASDVLSGNLLLPPCETPRPLLHLAIARRKMRYGFGLQ